MKALVCEMCGSQNLIKKDGVFVCEMCGTKYSVEDAKKMMVEGTVKIDNSDELQRLYQAARIARSASDGVALHHYERISVLDPESWEAMFYLVILKCKSIKNGEIESAANRIYNSLQTVFTLVANIENDDEKKEVVREIIGVLASTTSWLTNASYEFYKSTTKGSTARALTGGVVGMFSTANHLGERIGVDKSARFAIARIMGHAGNCIEAAFDMEDDVYREAAVRAWEAFVGYDNLFKKHHNDILVSAASKSGVELKIKKYKKAVDEKKYPTKEDTQTPTVYSDGKKYKNGFALYAILVLYMFIVAAVMAAVNGIDIIIATMSAVIVSVIMVLVLFLSGRKLEKKAEEVRDEILNSKRIVCEGPASLGIQRGWAFFSDDAIEFYEYNSKNKSLEKTAVIPVEDIVSVETTKLNQLIIRTKTGEVKNLLVCKAKLWKQSITGTN